MAQKPTYEELEKRVKELEKAELERKKILEALQESRERFRTIVNVLPQFVAYVDKDLKFRFANHTYKEKFGPTAKDISGKTLPEVIGRAAFEKARPHVEKALKGERVSYNERFDYAAGGSRDIHGTLIPDITQNGEVRGYYAVLTDITPYIKIQEALPDENRE